MSTWTVLKDLMKKNYLLENVFLGLQKTKKLVMMGKCLKDYLICEKNWDKSDIKNMGDYDDHFLKRRCIVISRCF